MSRPARPVFVPFGAAAAASASSSSSSSNNAAAASMTSSRTSSLHTTTSTTNKSVNGMQLLKSGECVPYQAPVAPQQVQLECITIEHEHPSAADAEGACASEETNGNANENAKETEASAPASTPATVQQQGKKQAQENTNKHSDDDDDCPICLEVLDRSSHHHDAVVVGLKNCSHTFHKACLQDSWKHQNAARCPVCRKPAAERTFGQSPSGSLSVSVLPRSCPGFRRSSQTLQLDYVIPSGVQQAYHDRPGLAYHGTSRTAYLPYNQDGLQLLQRLVYAFEHGFSFQVGTSLTTGRPNCVTWSSIHHKTSLHGGAHGFPDASYLQNCHGSLDALHVPAAANDSSWNPSFPLQVHYRAPMSMPSVADAMVILSSTTPQKRLKLFKNGVNNSNRSNDSANQVFKQQPIACYCSLCHAAITEPKALRVPTCQHVFHESCWTSPAWNCSICHASVVSPNNSSPSGVLQLQILAKKTCPGFDSNTKIMECRYEIPPQQIQQPYHPNPGLAIPSTTRVTYLPFNQHGCDLYVRLRYAWKRGCIFKIGTSLTSGKSNVVVWNAAIPHKTSLHGGPFGFPDASFLTACHAALDAFKIPNSISCWVEWEKDRVRSSK